MRLEGMVGEIKGYESKRRERERKKKNETRGETRKQDW